MYQKHPAGLGKLSTTTLVLSTNYLMYHEIFREICEACSTAHESILTPPLLKIHFLRLSMSVMLNLSNQTKGTSE